MSYPPVLPPVAAIRMTGRPSKPVHTRRLPRAPVPLNLGDTVSIGGIAYQVQLLPALVPVGSPVPTPTPSPTPVPGPLPVPKPGLTGIRNLTTGLLVTSATPGTPLAIEGTALGDPGGRVQLAGRVAASPTAWTPTAIQFLAPDPGPTAVSGGWDVYQPAGNTFILIASSGLFTLLPAGTPVPVPVPPVPVPVPGPVPVPVPVPDPGPVPVPGNPALVVTGFRDAMGQPADLFLPGSTVFIQGQNFGTAAGTVEVGLSPARVLLWTPTEIQIICPSLPTGSLPGPAMLTVIAHDSGQWNRLKAFTIGRAPTAKARKKR